MMSNSHSAPVYIALVTFVHDGDFTQILPPHAEGACGWIAVRATDDDQAETILRSELKALGLRVEEVEDMTAVSTRDDVASFSTDLAEEMKDWDPTHRLAWGTLHVFIGEGEA